MRIDGEPGFVLHSQPYRETSQLVDLFTFNHGRLRCVAKGVRKSGKRGSGLQLFPFTEMQFGWSGRHELKTLVKAEQVSSAVFLQGNSLFIGLYINELFYRLLHEHDPHPHLYQQYSACMALLSGGELQEKHLRLLEIALLEELGYGLALECDSQSGLPLEDHSRYCYLPEQGVVTAVANGREQQFSGAQLSAIALGQLDDVEVLASAKQLLRGVLNHFLHGKPLNSRQLYRDYLQQQRDR